MDRRHDGLSSVRLQTAPTISTLLIPIELIILPEYCSQKGINTKMFCLSFHTTNQPAKDCLYV